MEQFLNISKRRPKSINISESSLLDLSDRSPELKLSIVKKSDEDLKTVIARFKDCASRLMNEFAVSVTEVHALIDEKGRGNVFDSETFILKNENTALQKTIE
jgi:hypothetical protein